MVDYCGVLNKVLGAVPTWSGLDALASDSKRAHKMKITKKSDSISVSKPEGTNVDYYLFSEYEVNYNEQLPRTTQTWHHHEKLWETICIVEGEIELHWRENGNEKSTLVRGGDVIETETTPHTLVNKTGKVARFLVFKQVLKGNDNRELFKNDKILD